MIAYGSGAEERKAYNPATSPRQKLYAAFILLDDSDKQSIILRVNVERPLRRSASQKGRRALP